MIPKAFSQRLPRPFNICMKIAKSRVELIPVFLFYIDNHRNTDRCRLTKQHRQKDTQTLIIIIKSSFNITPLTQTQRSLQMSIIENRAKVIKKKTIIKLGQKRT